MNHRTDHERLLDEVLAEAMPAEFRAALLGETLRHARRRRHWRRARQAVAGLALLTGLAVLVWRSVLPYPVAREVVNRGLRVIQTHPLPGPAWVPTMPLPANAIVSSLPGVEVITTVSAGAQFREIDDGQLLALVAPKPVALVRLAPHSAELVFVHRTDEELFLGN